MRRMSGSASVSCNKVHEMDDLTAAFIGYLFRLLSVTSTSLNVVSAEMRDDEPFYWVVDVPAKQSYY